MSADHYDKPKAREYQELMDVINRRGDHGEEVYGNLMKKEKRVLDTVDRVVNDARLQEAANNSFLNLSVLDITRNTAKVLRAVYAELLFAAYAQDWRRALKAVSVQERRIYLGLVLVVLSLALLMVNASS